MEGAPKEPPKKPGDPEHYKAQFLHVWRERYQHLHPDVVAIAVRDEWRQMFWDKKRKKWVRKGRPSIWRGPKNKDLIRSNR